MKISSKIETAMYGAKREKNETEQNMAFVVVIKWPNYPF
jgi:hypothetical protein